MDRVVRECTRIEIAHSMLDTAIKIYLDGGDRFSVSRTSACCRRRQDGVGTTASASM